MKVVTVVGARPQFVKAAAVSAAIEKQNATADSTAQVQQVLVHTGQHYDYAMSAVFFEELRLPAPAYNLGVGSLPHGAQTGRMLEAIEQILLKEQPDALIVYGDTNSTLAGALAAAKIHVRVAHVEAGLRSFNRRMPEEMNRVLTDHASTWLFCPTETATKHLASEGITSGVHLVGDVMYEMLLEGAARAPVSGTITRLGLSKQDYALATVHRAENTDNAARLRSIFGGLAAASDTIPIVLALHPRTRAVLSGVPMDRPESFHVVEALPYREMLAAERDARVILTDSGGVQKEAFWLGVPCITLREETEWPETLVDGRNVLAGADSAGISQWVRTLVRGPTPGLPVVRLEGAAERIIAQLLLDR